MEKKSKIIKRDHIDEDVSLEGRLDLDEFSEADVPSEKKVISQTELEDRKKATQFIQRAQLEAKKIKDKAKEIFLQIEQKMHEARQKGFEQGRQEGLATVTEELAKIQENRKLFMEAVEKEAIELVHEIAKKIMGETLGSSDEALVGMMKQALQSSLGNSLTLFVNPNDLERVKSNETSLMNILHTSQTISIKPSENVRESGCVVESELGTIDAQLDYQLEAIKKALGI